MINFNQIIEVHHQIRNSNLSLNDLYPIVTVEKDLVSIFDIPPSTKKYELITQFCNSKQWSLDMAAAFPVKEYAWKCCAVIGINIINQPDFLPFLFHEFVHCYQFRMGDRIKENLEIYKKSMQVNNYMWELNHPFPYNDPHFISMYQDFKKALLDNDSYMINNNHHKLYSHLSKTDYEYLSWQHWGEGFARYLENQIRLKLQKNSNLEGIEIINHERIAFYAVGDLFINHISHKHPEAIQDLNLLWSYLFNPDHVQSSY